MTREEAIKILSSRDGHGIPSGYNGGYAEAIEVAIETLKAESFYDGYAYCLMDFGKDAVLCKDCKHQERIAGYSDYQPNTVFCNKWEHLTDIQGYCYKGEREDEVEE